MAGPFPCSNPPSTCETNPNPATSFSSEAADSTTFIALAWNNQPPPLGQPFTATPCEAIVESQVSQADADRIAANQAVNCSNPCATPVFNTPQIASALCPDGNPYSYTVPAGLFSAENQVLADRKAFTAAAAALRGHSICLGSVAPVSVCRGEFYFGIISIVTTDNPVTTELVQGELPEGLTFSFESTRVVIQGTPAAFGNAQFLLRCTSAAGVVTTRQYTITVTGIVTSSLSGGTVGDAYSAQLTTIIPSGLTAAWAVTAGALPDGLSLDATTGIISGDPTTAETSHFTISVTVGTSICSRDFSIQVTGGALTCINDTGVSVGPIGNTPQAILINSRSATARRLVGMDTNLGVAVFVNTQTNAIIANSAISPFSPTGVSGNNGDLCCFATSTNRFFININTGLYAIAVCDVNGNLTATIPSPVDANNYNFSGNLVYSDTADRVYTLCFSNVTNTFHILEINPHTLAVTDAFDTGLASFGVLGAYPGNLIITYPASHMTNYSLPGFVQTGITGFFWAAGEFDYDPISNRLFVGRKNFADNPMVSMVPGTLVIDQTFTPTTNMEDKWFVKYNPVLKLVIVYSPSQEITVINPATPAILCETNNTDPFGSGGGIGIDYSSGDVYLFDDNFGTNPLNIFH